MIYLMSDIYRTILLFLDVASRRIIKVQRFYKKNIYRSLDFISHFFMSPMRCPVIFCEFTFIWRHSFNAREIRCFQRIWRVTAFSGGRRTTISLRKRIFQKIVIKRDPTGRKHGIALFEEENIQKSIGYSYNTCVYCEYKVNCEIEG